MFTAFMDDAANILSFQGDIDSDGSVGYALELSIFNQQKSGQQVSTFNKATEIEDYLFLAGPSCYQDWKQLL